MRGWGYMDQPLYFGCWGGVGHYYWRADRTRVSFCDTDEMGPWGLDIDGQLTPRSMGQSAAALHHQAGWTALAMWDYTVDRRPGSNSAFLFPAELTFEHALDLVEEVFPIIYERIMDAAPIRLAD